MKRLIKTLLVAVAGIVLLIIVSAAALLMFFDPNDFRERISAEVEKSTGRELVIEGDLSVSLFPWLAVEVGRTELGNAQGFGETPFATFESARLSVRLVPLLLRREVTVSTVELDELHLALSVNRNGVSNWDDLTDGDNAATESTANDGGGQSALEIAGIVLSDALIRYVDAESSSDYTMKNLSLTTGRIAFGESFDFESSFDFDLISEDIDGRAEATGSINLDEDFNNAAIQDFAIDGQANGIAVQPTVFRMTADEMLVDLNASTMQPTEMRFSALGVDLSAQLKSMSWDDDLTGEATLKVARFSPRALATALDIEVPATADPSALDRASFSAEAAYVNDTIGLKKLSLKLDDTTFTGELVAPLSGTAPITFALQGDSMHLDRYMAPAVEGGQGGGTAEEDDFEIPVEMIRDLNARGTLKLASADFSGMAFTNIELGLNSANGKLRLNPVSAELFNGNYTGDVQVDASGATPSLSMNERVAGVSLSPLGTAMFERDELSGTINGSFVLSANGKTLNTMRRNLNGNMAFELADGAWEGVDIWQQLRTARALYRREAPPAARSPARTEFSSVVASGPVVNGVFMNNEIAAEMPFLQIGGSGKVDLMSAELDYSLRARVLERPEFLKGATEAELAEFTEALIPVRITGTLAEPKVRPDIEAMFRDEVEGALKKKTDDLKKRLLDRLAPPAPANEAPAAEQPAAGEEPAAEKPAEEEEKSAEDQLKERLKRIFD